MNYILTMSLSGSCLYILYWLVRLWGGNRLREGWYYNLLKIVMLYFMIPLPWLKACFIWLAKGLKICTAVNPLMFYAKENWVLLYGENGWKLNDGLKLQICISGIWGIGVIVVGMVLLAYYLAHKKKLKNVDKAVGQERVDQSAERLTKEMHVSVPVQFLECSRNGKPMTVGFIRPIVFYHRMEHREETEMILRHELVHIKRRDAVWCFLSIILIAMHWYNPLAWWFKRELENVCERSCDEVVLESATMRTRAMYLELILKYTISRKGEIFALPLSKEGKEVERRMKKIMEQTKKLSKAVSMVLIAVLVAVNSITVLAYEDVEIYHAEMPIEDIPTNADMAFIPTGEALVWELPDYVMNYERVYDNQFVDQAGNVYEVQEAERRFYCEHEYIEGMQQLHVDLEDGGCRVEFYNAKRCQLCGYLIDIELVSKTEYTVCPH